MRNTLLLVLWVFLAVNSSLSRSAYSAGPEKDWTMLVYLNGNNDLDPYAKPNINQMEKVGSSDQVNLVVQWASLQRKSTQRLYITRDNTAEVTSPIIEEFPDPVDMGNWKNLVEFIRWGVANYPAKHYFVNVWNHGNGWHLTEFNPTDISFDDISGNFISTKELGLAMREAAGIIGHKVDLFTADACLMAMIEVMQEMTDSVDVFGASQEVEPAAGWPYEEILRTWSGKGKVTPAELATILTQEYVKSYSGGSNGKQEVTFSAVDLKKIGKLVDALKMAKEELLQLPRIQQKKLIDSANRAQHFTYFDYADINDLVSLLEVLMGTSGGFKSAAVVREALKSAVIMNKTTPKYQRASGISIWAPGRLTTYSKYSDRYEELNFGSQTGWGKLFGNLLTP